MGLNFQLNKKGIIFTLLGVFLIAFLVTITTLPMSVSMQNKQFVLTNRLQSMNTYINNVKADSEIAVYTSGFRSLVSLIQSVSEDGNYISSVPSAMRELMLQGTYGGDLKYVMVNNTLINWSDRMAERASNIGINLVIIPDNISIYQTDPWNIKVEVDFSCSINDSKGLAYWNFSFTDIVSISVEGFDDPMFIVETSNLVNREIQQTPYYGDFVRGGDTSNITDHIVGGYYINHTGAPSIMNRFEGNFSANEFGIESLVDKVDLASYMPIDSGKTSVDHIYFSSDDPINFGFFSMPAFFRLDNSSTLGVGRVDLYNLTNLVN